jgi:hypothetical protein
MASSKWKQGVGNPRLSLSGRVLSSLVGHHMIISRPVLLSSGLGSRLAQQTINQPVLLTQDTLEVADNWLWWVSRKGCEGVQVKVPTFPIVDDRAALFFLDGGQRQCIVLLDELTPLREPTSDIISVRLDLEPVVSGRDIGGSATCHEALPFQSGCRRAPAPLKARTKPATTSTAGQIRG